MDNEETIKLNTSANDIEQRQDKIQQRVTEMASRKVGYAAERNIQRLLDDLEAQRSAFADNDAEDGIDMVIKLRVTMPRPQRAVLEVTSVTWTAKTKRVDRDFEVGEVNLAQPSLPGFNDHCEVVDRNDRPQNQPKPPADFDEMAWQALLRFAVAEKMRIFWQSGRMLADLKTDSQGNHFQLHPMETTESVINAIEMAAQKKDVIAIINGAIVAESVANLTRLGANVYRLSQMNPSRFLTGLILLLSRACRHRLTASSVMHC